MILVVDDHAVIRELLQRVLELDYDILQASDGPAALQLVRTRRVDLVLLDLLFPGMNGVEILSRLRNTNPEIPVIVVTGAATVPMAVSAMKLGALDCLIKPFENEELRSRVRDALGRGSGLRHVQAASHQLLMVGTHLGLAILHVAINTRVPTDTAWTLAEASEKLNSRSYAAILLDDSVTPVDGLVLLRTVRVRLPSSWIVVLAHHREAWTGAEFEALGIGAVVLKPYRLNDLMDQLAAAIANEHEQHAVIRFNSVVARAVEYLGEHFAQTAAPGAVADSIGVSSGHLASVCRADLGMTPRQLLTGMRIEITKHLLRNTDMKIEAIASEVGFHDASHLSRVFKGCVRIRPGRYRHGPAFSLVKPKSFRT